MADATYQPKTYRKDGGDEHVIASGGQLTVESGGEIEVESGGVLDIESGGALKLAGTAVTSTAAELNTVDGLTRGSIIVGTDTGTGTLAAKTSAQILIGDGNDLKSVAVSGDIAIANTGAVTIQALSVEEGMIAAAAVTTDKINDKAVTAPKTSGVAVLYNLGAPALAVANKVCESQDMDNKTYTLSGAPQPDIPRNVTVTRTVNGAADTPGIITVTGTNYSDAVITEDITPGANGVVVAGTKAFKTITSVVGTGWAIADAADSIVVGTGDELGLHVGTNVSTNIMLGILGVTVTAHNPTVGGTVAVETTTIDMSAGTYDGAKAALVFQKN